MYSEIIPYQELLGNYDPFGVAQNQTPIIPYQELLGNYDSILYHTLNCIIIPYQELLGNYDAQIVACFMALYYTIPRAIREL